MTTHPCHFTFHKITAWLHVLYGGCSFGHNINDAHYLVMIALQTTPMLSYTTIVCFPLRTQHTITTCCSNARKIQILIIRMYMHYAHAVCIRHTFPILVPIFFSLFQKSTLCAFKMKKCIHFCSKLCMEIGTWKAYPGKLHQGACSNSYIHIGLCTPLWQAMALYITAVTLYKNMLKINK